MFPYNYVLAAALLASTENHVVPLNESPDILFALRNLAVDWEILDPREVRYVLATPEDFTADMNLLRRRYADLGPDVPFVADSQRFPSREDCNEMISFNRAYYNQLNARHVKVYEFWEHNQIIQETAKLYQIWDTVKDTKIEYYYITVRRQALKKLREELGDEAYYLRVLPPPVPLWRFQSIP
jgi:hypothetical protein